MKRKKKTPEERADQGELTRRLQEMIARYTRLVDEQRREAGA